MSVNADKSEFERMDTETLESLLRMDIQQAEADRLDTDTILHISKILAERRKASQTENTYDAHMAWAEFNKKYRPFYTGEYLLNDEDELIESNSKESILQKPKLWSRKLRWGVAAVICIFLFAGTASAAGYDILGAIIQWSSETFQFINLNADKSDAPGEDDIEYLTLEDALAAYEVQAEGLIPNWMPERYEFAFVQVDETPLMATICANYKSDSGFLKITISCYQEIIADIYEKDSQESTFYESGGVEHLLVSNNENVSAVWAIENCDCTISGDVSMAEMKEIIDSIYLGV